MNSRRPSFHLVLFLTLGPAAACGGSSDTPDAPSGGPDAVSIDAVSIDAVPPDAGPPPEGLIGTWRELPTWLDPEPVPLEDRAVLTLEGDGTWTLVEDGMTETATWLADAESMIITFVDGAETHTLELDYIVTTDRLMLAALLPVGPIVGSVGTWHGEVLRDLIPITATLELRADNTAHYERTQDSDPPEIYDGTWSHVVDDVVFTTMIDTTTVNLHFKELVGVALGSPLLERLPAAKPARTERTGSIGLDFAITAPLR